MRDRLIELLEAEGGFSRYMTDDERRARLADHLLAEGVIVPPCKVGQTIYCIRFDKTRKAFVKPLGVLSISAYGKGNFTVFTTKEDTWGITAFATAEEAEKALGRSENGKS